MKMPGTLIVATLTVKSSYLQNIEEPATDSFDTVQIWVTPERNWRIVTFTVDHDIHTYEIDLSGINEDPIEFWQAHLRRIYGDVLKSIHILTFADANDRREAEMKLADALLYSHLEISQGQFAFWNPDNQPYKTQSVPQLD